MEANVFMTTSSHTDERVDFGILTWEDEVHCPSLRRPSPSFGAPPPISGQTWVIDTYRRPFSIQKLNFQFGESLYFFEVYA
jgi:hypothetical protein